MLVCLTLDVGGFGRGLFLMSDSARARLNVPPTFGSLTVLGMLAPDLAAAVEGVAEDGRVGLEMLIFGFGAASGAGEGAEDDAAELPACSSLGVAGPDSFSRRRLRIYTSG